MANLEAARAAACGDSAAVRFVLDGRVQCWSGPPAQTVLNYLRERIGRTGTKEGCAEGDCGACTVVIAELDANGRLAWRAVNSCIQFVATLDGKALFTVESLKGGGGDGSLHPVQQAMADGHGSQCGFCTPGFVMSLFALYKTDAKPDRRRIEDALSGNLCRCTGYRPIVAAAVRMYELGESLPENARDLTAVPAGAASERAARGETALAEQLRQLRRGAPLQATDTQGRFFAPRTIGELTALRSAYPQARLLAGGTDVGLWVTKQLRHVDAIIYLGQVDELRRIDVTATHVRIGAAATLAEAGAVLCGHFPELSGLLRRFASPPIRNVATLGGNLANGSPIGDMIPPLIALGARIVLSRGGSRRELALEDFYLAYQKTALASDEILEQILVPLPAPLRQFRVYKLSKRFDQDISIVCAAFAAVVEAGRVRAVRIAFGGMAATPRRAPSCEAALERSGWCEDGVLSAAQALDADFSPIDDMRGTAAYRMRAARNLLRRFFVEASPAAARPLTRIDALAPTGDRASGTTIPARESGGIAGRVGSALRHDSAHLHVSGEAAYTDDTTELRGTLHAAFGLSQRAHARIRTLDLSQVRAASGVVAVLTAAELPGENNFGSVVHDDPILADGVVHYFGQPMFLVAAATQEQARRAARLAVVDYEDLPAILTVEEALAQRSFVLPTITLERGDWKAALAGSRHRLKGTLRTGAQEQFYLEGQVSYAVPLEDGQMRVQSSTQHPTEVQHMVAHALGAQVHRVTVECRRMGGAFGGKESQPAQFACAAAVMARHTGRPVKLRLDRDDDFLITGKRHDFLIEYDVGFDASGRIRGLDLVLASRCGYSADLSGPVNDRAVMHADNCYFLPSVRIQSHRCRTNTQSATAFRGFGGPQGMMAIEYVIDEIARFLARDPLEVRKLNFYVPGERDTTPYGMRVEDFIARELVAQLERESDYAARRATIRDWNATHPFVKRGIALTPVKFGISFTATHLNQAGALVHVYTDGSVLLNHGGTEMGQGLFTKVAQVVAEVFQIDVGRVHVSATSTAKVPNTSATAASSGSDLNGKAAQAAAMRIRERLSAFAASHFGVSQDSVRFAANQVHVGARTLAFHELVQLAFRGRVQLWSDGFYATPKIGYDPRTLQGRPYYYFCYGAAVSEVAIDTLTGECRLLRADLLHDAGRSINPAIDLGQIEGGFVQGMGWLVTEELFWDASGRLRTHSPSTYKIPVASDVPEEFNVTFWKGDNVEESIHRSKAVGEPPLMLAISVFHAIKDAIAGAVLYRVSPRLNAPATPQEILSAVEHARSRAAGGDSGAGREAAA